MKLIDKLNPFLFDMQMKRRFRPNRKSPKVCKWCKKDLSNEERWGAWVDGNGNAEYECVQCQSELDEKKKEAVKNYSICRGLHYQDIAVCSNCASNKKCDELLHVTELQFKADKVMEQLNTTSSNY